MKNKLALAIVFAVSMVLLAPVVSAGETQIDLKVDADENIYAALSFDGENVWVEIEGITVRQRFDNLESAISYVNNKYDMRTNTLMNNDHYFHDKIDAVKEEIHGTRNKLVTEHEELEKKHRGLKGHFFNFANHVHNRLTKIQFQVEFLYFALCGVVPLAIGVLLVFAPEIETKKANKEDFDSVKEELEELKKKYEEGY